MPLRDHFHPPLSARRHWEGFHSKWTSAIVDQLDQQLPDRYFAEPTVHYGAQVEIDVATFEEQAAAFDSFEVRIIQDEGGPRLVAAIELVSPGNKDRAFERRAFAMKCGAYLQQGVSLIVVDMVTSRSANLHHELLDLLSLGPDVPRPAVPLYGAAYRTLNTASPRLDIWLELLALGGPLPALPLWLNPHDAVLVDLEQSYEATCHSLRIP